MGILRGWCPGNNFQQEAEEQKILSVSSDGQMVLVTDVETVLAYFVAPFRIPYYRARPEPPLRTAVAGCFALAALASPHLHQVLALELDSMRLGLHRFVLLLRYVRREIWQIWPLRLFHH